MKKINKIFFVFTILTLCIFIAGCKKCNKCKKDEVTEYTIKFVVENNVVSEKKVEENYTLVQEDFPENPTKEGFDFDGWYIETLKVSAGYIINKDTTLNAQFKEIVNTRPDKEDGSKEYPYYIDNADELVNFADRINHFDEETEDLNYYKAYFKLGNDIDMSGVKFTPIGKEIEIINDDESFTVYGFMGHFDGNGYAIKNLEVSVNMKTNREYYGGLFALTHSAYIHDLSLENINYYVESGSDDASRSIVMGGLVAQAELSVFENISVTGTITSSIFANNGAYFGGIAGIWNVSDSSNAYYAYARNCYTNVETIIGEIEGEECSLENAINGGLFGYVYNYNSTVAIINSTTVGKVYGGKYVGGLAGYLASNNVSILDSSSYATVYATATEVSYTGGLIGMAQGDTVVKDCFFNGGVVRGTRANSASYQSYVGGIVGFATEDDYSLYYTAGIACINSYYNTTIRGANNTSKFGISVDDSFTLDYVAEKLKWNKKAWELKDDKLVPTNIDVEDVTYKINLVVNGEVVNTIDKPVEKGDYQLFGALEDGENFDSQIFFNWQIQEGSEYRFYMPVIKDMEVYGKYFDVSSIAGVYTGTGTLYETIDAGIIVLNNDGTLQWINSSTVGGTYKYDGQNIVFEIYNSIGTVTGTIEDGAFNFLVDAGMSGEVTYNFIKSDLTFFGEYFSSTGDILTFGGEDSVSFQSTLFNLGSYTGGTFIQEGNVLTVTGKYLESTYSSMTIIDNGDMTLTVNFVSKNPNVPSLENVVFSKIFEKDYSMYNFNKDYNLTYVSGLPNPLQSDYVLTLNEDGTGAYKSQYVTTNCEYYVFNNGKTIKLILEGYASEFTYDEEGDFFYGNLNRGTANAKRSIAMTPVEEGKIMGLVISDISNVLFVNDVRSFLFVDGLFQNDAVIEVPSKEKGSHVTINGEEYILFYNDSEYTSNIGYYLEKIGPEIGTYTYEGKTIKLDGIGNVTGDINGFYKCYENDLIVIITDDDKFIGFNHKDALDNNNVITLIAPSKYQGVWYSDYTSTNEVKEKYYKLLIDGYGHSAFMYRKYIEETGESYYEYNWGSDSGWVAITETETGIECDYNKYQHCEMRFYYNDNLMYSTNFGYIKTIAMYKDGYTGAMVPPTLPSNVAGSYIGENEDGTGIVLNIRQDLNGSYNGVPFAAVYDGEKNVIFKVNGVSYSFNIITLELAFNEKIIQLASNGAIQEIIPEVICGVWGGSWEGMGVSDGTTILIEKDGRITYVAQVFTDVTFDYSTMTIVATAVSSAGEDLKITIVYNEDAQTINVNYEFVYDGESYLITGSNLTKK